ncbi:MAG: CRISPR-associated protein Csx15 [Anaerolineae bacterium]
MALEIDYAGLKEAMSRYDPLGETLYYLDTETGDVLVIDDWTEQEARQLSDPDQTDDPALRLAWHILWYDGEIGEELPEAEERAMYEQVEAFLDRYIPVPTADSRESYQDMVNFATTVSDPHLRGMLEVALAGKGAFRRFKDVLTRYPQGRRRWFEFSAQRLQERVDGWLRLHGLLSDEEGEATEEAEEPAGPEGTAETEAPKLRTDVGSQETRGVVVLNFAHPLTSIQLKQIEALTGEVVERVVDVPVHLDTEAPFEPQVRRLVDHIRLSDEAWQGEGVLINPPGYAPATAVILSELHGRMGHFPAILRIRPVAGSSPTRYEVAEVINLQGVRDTARRCRQ